MADTYAEHMAYTQQLEFTVDGQPADTFAVFRFTGREAISELFRFEVDLVSDQSEIDLEALVGSSASLTITRLDQSRTIHGMLERLEQHGATPTGRFIYRAVLVPRLKQLALTRQNQIHGTTTPVTVREVLAEELTADSLHGSPAASVAGRLGHDDFELRLVQAYPQRDYIVQYDESDFDFVSRLCEHYGIFYFFTHDSGHDVVVFGDTHVAFPHVAGPGTISYRTASGLSNAHQAAVYRFVSRISMVPAQVCLRDYNYRIPNLTLEVDEAVDPNGHGVVVEYGAHFRNPEEGRDLARVRAEELASRKSVFEGASDSVHLTAGGVFDLTDHFRSDFNDGYLVTWIEHEGTQALAGVAEFTGPDHQTSYRNRFECLPKEVEFRPARTTPKPRIPGLSNAVVDAAGTGLRAEIDASGRYKIRQQFDQRGEADGQSSRYMRKAEPYGGANTGMHFPLLKGTEVVLACVNGDPDRPIIVGAMQNEQYPSIVNARNSNMNRMRTTSGTLFEIDDGPIPGDGGGSGAGSGANLAPQRALEGPMAVATPRKTASTTPGTPQRLAAQRAEADIQTSGGASSAYARLQITSGTASYWRLGSAPSDSTETSFTPGMSDMTSSAGGNGLFAYTAGDSSSLIKGSSYREVDVDSYDYVVGTRRTSAATHTAVSTGDYEVVGKSVSIQATDGTITANSSAPEAGSGEVKIKTSGDFTLSCGGHSNVQNAGTSFAWFQGSTTGYRSGSTFNIYLGSYMQLNTGSYSRYYLGTYKTQFWLGMHSDIGIGLSDFKLRIAPAKEFYVIAKVTFNGWAEVKANLVETKSNIAAKIDTASNKLVNALASIDTEALQAYSRAMSAGTGFSAHI